MNYYFNSQRQKYIFYETYTDYLTGETKKVTVSMPDCKRPTQRMAKEILREKMEKAELEKTADRTLGELFDDYVKFQKRTIKKSTWMRNEYTCRKVVERIGRKAICSRLTSGTIIKALPENPTTYNNTLIRVKAMLRWGYENDYLDDIRFLDKIKRLPDKSDREKVTDKFLESDDLQFLTQMMTVERWKLFTQFLALTGMRSGEAIALLREDVDLRARLIRVNKTYGHNTKEVTSTKTFDSTRDVYIQDELVPVITQIHRWRMKYCGGSPIFFPDLGGGYIDLRVYEKYFAENTEAVLKRHLTPHCLRHTHASLCFEQGMSLEAVSLRLGHSDSRITKEIYTHVTDKKKAEYNSQLDRVTLFC